MNALIEAGRVNATASAFNGARELGINDLAGMCAVVMSLTPTDFYKSMTTYADHRIWQDVYRTKSANSADVYLKLTVIDDSMPVRVTIFAMSRCITSGKFAEGDDGRTFPGERILKQPSRPSQPSRRC